MDRLRLIDGLKSKHRLSLEEIKESLTSRDLVVRKVSDSLVKKLKEVSHGLALKGTCKICSSWSEPQ